jgi:imidazolonepropionase-like amidohydrolase
MIRAIQWNDEAESHMRHPAAGKCIEYLKREVAQGISKLWHCQDETDEAYMVTRVDSNPTELVVCYFEGSGLIKFGRQIVAAAHARKIPVRIHTVQEPVARLCRRVGLQHRETIMRSAP